MGVCIYPHVYLHIHVRIININIKYPHMCAYTCIYVYIHMCTCKSIYIYICAVVPAHNFVYCFDLAVIGFGQLVQRPRNKSRAQHQSNLEKQFLDPTKALGLLQVA